MAGLKSKYELILEKLKAEGKVVSTIDAGKIDQIVAVVEQKLDEYRFENQKRIRESQEEIATVILTA